MDKTPGGRTRMMMSAFHSGHLSKFKMAARYHVGSDWY